MGGSSRTEPYAPAVVKYFARAAHAADGPVVARGGSLRQGVVIEFQAVERDSRLTRVGFRVWGCPHIIAGCARLAELLDGAPPEALVNTDLEAAFAEFDIPVEKAGKILILKDTLREGYERLSA